MTTLGFEEDTPAGPALILEYVEGQSLDEFLSAGPSDSAKDCIIDDILDGVDYLHHRGVLHNDIKPSNIVINPHGAARITIYQSVKIKMTDYFSAKLLKNIKPNY